MKNIRLYAGYNGRDKILVDRVIKHKISIMEK